MIIRNFGNDFGYHIEKIALIFFPLEKLGDDNGTLIETKLDKKLSVRVKAYGKEVSLESEAGSEDMARAMSLLLYKALSELTGFNPPWGILYGVRPARLFHSKAEELSVEGAESFFREGLVSESKIALTKSVMNTENKIISLSKDNSFSLYVSIPFCPSRCSYCSFVSHSIENAGDLIEPYVDLLCRELEATAKTAKELSLRLESIYFGGGTPTTLSASQLDRLLCVIENSFDLSTLREYTVEAGRADTISREKLETLKKHGVGRISINPQSFNNEVLKNIGRKHTAEQVVEAFALAKEIGFDNINMDFIAGLNGESLDSFKVSIDKAVELGADSVTVHNLALKSGAYLVTENENYDLKLKSLAFDMVEYSAKRLAESGYYPYYMYRQSKSLGSLENVGWCKEGKECLYNIFMMDETHSVLAAGAGAVTLLKNPETKHIERIYNLKYPYEYINRFDEILNRKKGIYDFYKA